MTTFPYLVTAEAVVPDDVPEGFAPLDAGGPYMRGLGQLYFRRREDGNPVIGLRVLESHLNVQGMTHGGMLTTVADGALGIGIAMARGKRGAFVTVSLTADFLSSGRLGDWLEAHVAITRMGQRMAYANCDLKVGTRHVLRASGVFALTDRPLPAPLPGASEPPLTDG